MNIALNSAFSASSSSTLRASVLAQGSSLLISPPSRSNPSCSTGKFGFLRLIRRQPYVSRVFTCAASRGVLRTGRSAFSSSFSYKPFTPVMEWQDCMVKTEVDISASAAYDCYSDREAIPQWMPFISSVQILEDKPDLSRWSLKYKAFGQDINFAWLARNLQPIPNQKIHWRSMEGLQNKGAVRFYPKGPSSCTIELTVSYEVPQILVPVASALQPFLESLLARGLERFARFAKSYKPGKSEQPGESSSV